ncbi:hypothetical protein AZE42_02680 [Rhizopogon vesiculosus]|uniref:Uncharacterized protein n=1 Tax=Rhizopogon vesiculosus TaxID=180088 RepID=A0A1J8R8M0_9AGAM|nr:hypothetical protein AZE42_02680 [Rhizopogon vesiculosus]
MIPHVLSNFLELTPSGTSAQAGFSTLMSAIRVPSQHNVGLKISLSTTIPCFSGDFIIILQSSSATDLHTCPQLHYHLDAITVDGVDVGGETIDFAMFPPKFKGRANGLHTLLVWFSCHTPDHQACITSPHFVLTRSSQNDLPKRVGYTQIHER